MKVHELLAALDGADPGAEVDFTLLQPWACCPDLDGDGFATDSHRHDVDDVPIDDDPVIHVRPMSSVSIVLRVGADDPPTPAREPAEDLGPTPTTRDVCSCGHTLAIHDYPGACRGGVSWPDDVVPCDCRIDHPWRCIARDRAACDAGVEA